MVDRGAISKFTLGMPIQTEIALPECHNIKMSFAFGLRAVTDVLV